MKSKESTSTPSQQYDVIVAGGGVAGTVAALAAARNGAKTLVIERLNCLGGNWTAGMMGTIWTFSDGEKLIIKGIPLEIVERLKQAGGVVSKDISKDAFTICDTELAKFILNDMAEECGLTILFHTFVSDAIVEANTVKGVVVQNKSGRQAVHGTIVVDATGDGDVAAWSGAPFEMRPKEKQHPTTLLARVGNVDTEELRGFFCEHPEFVGSSRMTFGQQHPDFLGYRLTGALQEPYKRGLLPREYEYLMDWFIYYYQPPRPREVVLNMTGAIGICGIDAWDLTHAEIQSRKRLLQALDCFKRFIPGFKDAYIMTTAPMIGVRESRLIRGEYVLTKEDILNLRRFSDAIASFNGNVGEHTPDGKDSVFSALGGGKSFDFPYRVLVPLKADNLLVAGRCISVAGDAMGTTRPMAACMAVGQAAGTAAALSVRNRVRPRDIDVKSLQRELLRQGAHIEGVETDKANCPSDPS